MQSLHDMQRGFACALLNSGMARPPVIAGGGLSPAMRLGFYRTNVFANYTKALRMTYPAIERLVGSAVFTELARQYIRRYPYGAGDLTAFGDQFAEFLAGGPVARQLPYLADVARLEWVMEEVFNEADHAGLSAQQLSSLPLDRCEQLRFLLHPAVRLLSSNYPLRRIWKACKAVDEDGGQVLLDAGGESLLVWRDGLEVTVEALGAGEYSMLAALSMGNDFGTGYRYAAEAQLEFDPAAFLRKFVAKRVLAGYTLPAEALG
ncbi:MAG: DUF2063 domain-containing protein [Burkholderiales bacterium]